MLVTFCLRKVQQLGPSPRPEGRHQQLELDLTEQRSSDSTSYNQVLSFHSFIGALMEKKHPVDCNSYCCCSNFAQWIWVF